MRGASLTQSSGRPLQGAPMSTMLWIMPKAEAPNHKISTSNLDETQPLFEQELQSNQNPEY